MKKLFIGTVIGCLLVPLALLAENITGSGMSQRALHKFLSNIVTFDNEVKADHNILWANYTGFGSEAKTDHNTLWANYTGSANLANSNKTAVNNIFQAFTSWQKRFNNFTSFAEMKAYDFGRINAAAVSQANAQKTSGANISRSSNPAAGTTTSDLSLSDL